MTAEEKLKKLYEKGQDEWQNNSYVARDGHGRVHISARDIDLIADLVVERIRKQRVQIPSSDKEWR